MERDDVTKQLTTDQYNALMFITSETKTDCWFCVETFTNNDGIKEDLVRDLENDDEIMRWDVALYQLYDAIDALGFDTKITKEHARALVELYRSTNVNPPRNIVEIAEK